MRKETRISVWQHAMFSREEVSCSTSPSVYPSHRWPLLLKFQQFILFWFFLSSVFLSNVCVMKDDTLSVRPKAQTKHPGGQLFR